MKKRFFLAISLAVLISVVFFSCKKSKDNSAVPASLPSVQQGKPPVANAGADQTIVLPVDSAELSGSGTDADGRIVSYQWNIIGYHSQIGQYVSFGYSTAIAKIRNLAEGTYWCVLNVMDDSGFSHEDELVVHVVSADCPCYPYPCDAFGNPCDPWDY